VVDQQELFVSNGVEPQSRQSRLANAGRNKWAALSMIVADEFEEGPLPF
jgi:hypothetical protein